VEDPVLLTPRKLGASLGTGPMVVRGNRPLLAMVVEIDQVFYHCAKAFLRSRLWDPSTWSADTLPSRPQIAQRQERPDESLEALERYYGEQYAAGLYPAG